MFVGWPKKKNRVYELDEKETAAHSMGLWLLVGSFIYVLHTASQLFWFFLVLL